MKLSRIMIGSLASTLSVAVLLIEVGIGTQPTRGAEPASAMTDLKNLGPLKQAFVSDQGKVRLLALLSPV